MPLRSFSARFPKRACEGLSLGLISRPREPQAQ